MANVTVKYKNSTIAEMSAEGTKTLKTSGKYCEGDITVNYVPPAIPEADPVNCKIYDITLAKKSGWVLLTTLDSDVLAHVNDPTFTVTLANMSDYAYEWYSGSFFFATNTPFAKSGSSAVYGWANRQIEETVVTSNPTFYPANNTGTSTSLGGFAVFRLNGSEYYVMPGDGFVRAGNYKLIFTW